MDWKRLLPFIMILLTLTGCFRQANDSFEMVDSRDVAVGQGAPQPINPTPTLATEEPAAILLSSTPTEQTQPTATDTQPPSTTPTEESTAVSVVEVPSETPTIIIIDPATDATDNVQVPTLLPTGTAITRVTPGAPAQLQFDTATPTPSPTPATVAQGDDDDGSTSAGGSDTSSDNDECTYIIRGGDTLFNIARRNEVRLSDLLTLNELDEDTIILPGQRILIPNCDESTTITPDDDDDGGSADEAPPTPMPDGVVIHVVSSGETLSYIAGLYRNASVADIVRVNDIPNPDRISLGQELTIPNQETDDDATTQANAAPTTTPTATELPPDAAG